MSRPPVIVTRAQPGAAETASNLRDLGFQAFLSPVLNLVADPAARLPDPAGSAGVIFTSANGVRFFCDRHDDRTRTAWCVGPATAEAARRAGFSDVKESAGNADVLADFINRKAPQTDRPFLHIANAAAKGHLAQKLKDAGRQIIFCPIYHAEIAPALAPATSGLLKECRPAIVLLHSAKGSSAFLSLSAHLPRAHLAVVSISEAAAADVRRAGLTQIFIAPLPNEAGLLHMVKEAATTLST